MSIRPSTFAKYEYDGLNRRVKKHIDPVRTGRTGVRGRSLWKNAESGILLRGAWARVSPKHNRGNRHFFYNTGWQILETRKSTTENTAPQDLEPEYQYAWSARYIDAPILRDKNTDEDGLCDDERLYYTTDANMNVTALFSRAGVALERYTYDAYGHTSVYDPDWESDEDGTDYDNVILFAGYYRDPETWFYHVRNRFYHAELGRWLQPDPLGYVDGLSLYEYVESGPMTATDPEGTDTSADQLINRIQRDRARVLNNPAFQAAARAGNRVADMGLKIEAAQKKARAFWKAFASYYSWSEQDLGVQGGLIYVAGFVKVTCCDEKNCEHTVELSKECSGLFAGIWASKHVLGNIKGKNCPDAYEDWFFEASAGLLVGVSLEIGVDTAPGERVSGAGGYMGPCLPIQFGFCEYTIVHDKITGKCK